MARRDYVENLKTMLTQSGFDSITFVAPKVDTGSSPKFEKTEGLTNPTVSPLIKNKAPIYTKIDFTVDAKGDLAGVPSRIGEAPQSASARDTAWIARLAVRQTEPIHSPVAAVRARR